MEILQIVPQLPPTISGVGDYAYLLAKQLRAAHDVHSRFVVAGQRAEGVGDVAEDEAQRAEGREQRAESSDFDGFPVYQLKERSAVELLRVLSAEGMPSTVLLQYVGYGYEKRGCPVWLATALRRWKMEGGVSRTDQQKPISTLRSPNSRRLITMFHELYAFGPPWRSSFWTSPLQRRLAAQLARLSDACVTNMRRYANWLGQRAPQHADRISALPVFSNVGEPGQVPAYRERPPRLAVFGTPGFRSRVYTEHRTTVEQSCKNLGLTEVVDIGAPCDATPRLSVGYAVRGALPPEQLSQELLSCRAGFFVYPVPFLGKSGIFAAYTAHGLMPITNPANTDANEDGLCAEDHFHLAVPSSPADVPKCSRIAANSFAWYGTHSRRSHAAIFAMVLSPGADMKRPLAAP